MSLSNRGADAQGAPHLFAHRGSRVPRLVALALVLLAAVAWGDARVEAKKHFKIGMSLIDSGRVDDGVAELLVAYSVKPHPNVLFNIARAFETANRPADALPYFQQYLEASPPDAEVVRRTIVRLEALLPPPVVIGPAKPEPARTVADAETLAKLTALTDRLERALQKAEAPAPLAEKPADIAPSPEDFSVPYEETVVAASRRAQSTLEAPNATTIITGDEIRASGLTTLPDILRRVPGAEVMTMGASSANVSFRGFNQRVANKVIVLIDGRTEYQDFLGVTLWATLPIGLEEIERIEVIRGPGSALYGANAMLGVINIITRAPGTGARAEANAMAGSSNFAGGSVVASGGDVVKYRASAGYQQADKFTRDYAADRPDVTSVVGESNLSMRSARGSITAFHAFSREVSGSLSAGINRFFTEMYALGLLRNFFLDGISGFAKADLTAGPLKLRFFWNHTDVVGGQQYEPRGQRQLGATLQENIFDTELLFQKELELAGRHLVGAGASMRFKRVSWNYLGELRTEFHAAAFVQDEWRIIKPLSLVASYRIDRHPLLDRGQPGYAQSPRVSVIVAPTEGQALRASFATAFRQPTFLESYMNLRTPVPGINGASVLTEGNQSLRPERLVSFEVGYRGEIAKLGLGVDVAAYWNIVSDLIGLSAVNPLPVGRAFDPSSASYLLGSSTFVNDPGTYTARGGELGVTWTPSFGLDLRLSTALQQVVSNENIAVCGPCTQAPALKVNGGFIYRSPINLDVSTDVSFVSSTIWVEREPSASDPTQIANLQNPLAAYVVINARVAYRLLNDRVTLALVGSQLGPAHQEHPFGNDVSRRVFAQVTVMP